MTRVMYLHINTFTHNIENKTNQETKASEPYR